MISGFDGLFGDESSEVKRESGYPKCSHTADVVSAPNLPFLNSLFLSFHGLYTVEF